MSISVLFDRVRHLRPANVSACMWLAAVLLLASFAGANAAPIHVVAIGASNTAGWGVGTAAAYPAQLEAMLRARGYDATVTNAGVSGDTSAMILARIDSAVPIGTRIVILQMGYYNDSWRGISQAENRANIAAAIARVRARGARLVFIDSAMFAAIPRSDYQYDGLHLAEAGHALLAARILPRVLAAIGHGRAATASVR